MFVHRITTVGWDFKAHYAVLVGRTPFLEKAHTRSYPLVLGHMFRL